MKPIIVSMLAMIILLPTAQNQLQAQHTAEIRWYTMSEAIEVNEKSRNKNKRKFFIDVYTDWCGWCKRMDQTTFKDPVIVKYLNENFWPVKFNAESSDPVTINDQTYVNPNPGARRSAHQLAIALLNRRLSYPSFAFMDEEVKLITVLPGYNTPEKLEPVLHYIATEAYLEMTFDQFQATFKGSFGE